jgi:hypothetical protein
MTCLRLGLRRKAWRQESKECVKLIHFCFMMTHFLLHSGVNEQWGHKSVPKWCPNQRNESRHDPPEVRAGRIVRYEAGATSSRRLRCSRTGIASTSPAYLLFPEVAVLLPQLTLALQVAPAVSGEHAHGRLRRGRSQRFRRGRDL